MPSDESGTNTPSRKPHVIAAAFYSLVALACLVVGFQGHPATLLGAIIAGLYAVYLWRGGRVVIFFF